MSNLLVTKSRLVADLQRLGVEAGQTVVLHVSVKNIGWVVGGPEVVLQALLEVLTEEGTLMMVAGWEDHPYHLAEWPPEKQQAYLAECPAFDPARSRAQWRKLSILAEYLRTWPGSRRSRHPFGFVAVGRHAEWITSEQPWNYDNGPGSPLAKLCEQQGQVLQLGSPTANVTLLHHAEHLPVFPNKRIAHYQMPVLIDGQRMWMEFEEYDTSRGIIDWPDDYFETIIREYRAAGHCRVGLVGAADSYLYDAVPLRDFAIRWMEEHFAL